MIGARLARCMAAASLCGSALLCATPAQAHLNATGMGPLYDGVAHFYLSPDDIAVVAALSLLAGLRGPRYGRAVLFVLPAAWLAGAFAAALAGTGPVNEIVLAGSLCAVGVLLAVDAKAPLRVMIALAVMFGLLRGFGNGGGSSRSDSALLSLFGIAAAVFVTVALTAALSARLRERWMRVAVQVAGSWIAATGLLMIGWSVRAR